jgi:hypothetical protein
MNSLEVAQIIQQQLYAGGRNKVWSWGANGWTHGKMPINEQGFGGENFLIFKVQGFLFKGMVRVILAWDDTYTVQLLKKEKGELVVKDEITNVYCDELTDIIDRKVEHCGDEEKYKQQVNKAKYKL